MALPGRNGCALVALVASARLFAAEPVESLQSCMEFADPSARLACFEAMAGAEAPLRDAELETLPEPESMNEEPVASETKRSGKAVQTVTVVHVDGSPHEALLFYLDSGEVWLQTQQRFVDLPDPPFTAQVSRGAFGSHRLRLHDKFQAIGIRRVQ